MNKQSIRNILIVLGLLDLFSFYRTHGVAREIMHSIPHTGMASILEFLLILSFLVSGVFFLLGKRWTFIVYYFQFPLKLAFLLLTFGFFLSVISSSNAMVHKVLVGFIIGLETVRLFITIWMHRRYTG